jgi:hypothetical protein
VSYHLDKFYSELHSAFSKEIETAKDNQTRIIVRKAHSSGTTFIPASTSEEIALTAVETATRVRALQEAAELVRETYKRMFEKENTDD